PIGGGHAFRLACEPVLAHVRCFLAPRPAVVPEVADQLLLLRIHADDRQAGSGIPFLLGSDVLELLVSIGAVTPRLLALVAFEGVMHLLEQPPHGAIRTYPNNPEARKAMMPKAKCNMAM